MSPYEACPEDRHEGCPTPQRCTDDGACKFLVDPRFDPAFRQGIAKARAALHSRPDDPNEAA